MPRFMLSKWLVLVATIASLSSCKDQTREDSATQSDWETILTDQGLNSYVIDWACEPKQFGSISETKISGQDEYCEWRTESTTETERLCRFTTSFDRRRDFYLNSRGRTPFNTISAARKLVDDCSGLALDRLEEGKTVGSLCSGLVNGCAPGRNSDPEICDKTRWAVGQKYEGSIDFCVDQLSPRDSIKTPRPLITFGILTPIPENCIYAAEDQTEVICTIPIEDDCFSVAGELRPGMRVMTKLTTDVESTLPSARECYAPR